MNKILLVDDEKNFLLSLADMLKANENEFEVVTAGDGREAAKIIDKGGINMVVTDLNMPEMDGFELMAHITHVNSDIPVIAMTAYGTPEMESRLMNMGAFQYIEKPIDYNSLLHKIKEGLKSGTKGHVSGISLPSFMQLLELDKKTCTLHVTSHEGKGSMFFQQGELISSKTGKMVGQEAAFEIINWDNSEIEIENVCKFDIAKRDINVPMGFLLIESARMKDEKNKPKEEREKEEKIEPATEALEGVDFDNIGFATKESEAKKETAVSTPSPKAAAVAPEAEVRKSPLEILSNTIINANGVNRMIIISGNGTVLSHNNIPVKEFGAFTAAVTGASIKIRKILGFTGPKHIVVNHSNGEKILIIVGAQVVAGIGLDSDCEPEPISELLKPTVSRLRA
ncbi:MAG: response regulator [Proteobacteria bacterium]|nr:response regulator [Pseudomonadota bacterium]MBU1738104.1 response regulator [Pseudomonadota bacterium]